MAQYPVQELQQCMGDELSERKSDSAAPRGGNRRESELRAAVVHVRSGPDMRCERCCESFMASLVADLKEAGRSLFLQQTLS